MLGKQGMLREQSQLMLLALSFFTRIPVKLHVDVTATMLNQASRYFALVGVLIGACSAIAFYLAAIILPLELALLISMFCSVLLTGAFHEDGLADSADGLGGGWNREKILLIMTDSRLGTYGAAALFLSLFAKFQLLNSLDGPFIPTVLIAGHAISRLAAVWVMATLAYAKPAGKAKPLATHISLPALSLANIVGLLPYLGIVALLFLSKHSSLLIFHFVLMTLIPMAMVGLWWRHKIKRWLDGYTGDTLGAMQQLTELAFYFGLVLWSVNH